MKDSASVQEPPVSANSKSSLATTFGNAGKITPTLFVGLDLGTNTSCLLAGPADSREISVSKIVPTVVGYAKDGLVEGIITNNASVLFGEAALTHRQQVNLVAPLGEGIISHREPARDFLHHLRALADPKHEAHLRAVVGVPANASATAREDLLRAATGIFDRMLLVPEPFLAALGYRDDSRLGQSNYADPVLNSLFIDIGGGTTDLCLVQGYFPSAEDQISLPFAGDTVDELIAKDLAQSYPNSGLSRHAIRQLKETHSYVGPTRKPIDAEVVVAGKARSLDIGEVIGTACNTLFDKIYTALRQLIARAPSDHVTTMLQNIIVTGGGSRIKGFDTVLQQRLSEDGYVSPKVRLAGIDYKRHVALGALKAARSTKEKEWQHLIT